VRRTGPKSSYLLKLSKNVMRNQKNEKENELYNQRVISSKIRSQIFLGSKNEPISCTMVLSQIPVN